MIPTFSHILLSWYSQHQRDLPWRHNPTPYQVLVSEIMLQQTQVPRVIEKYREFLTLFPTLEALAQAPKADVLHTWSGLGYNRRALLLQQFAQEVLRLYAGQIPEVPEALRKLPGIGPYAAGSIAAFAFNRPEPAIDVNVRRIFLRYFNGRDQGLPGTAPEEKKLFQQVKEAIPPGRSADFHNALMDFGSLMCQRNTPLCNHCPLQSSCKFAPLYQQQPEKVLFVAEKRTEPGKTELGKHLPNRIFRGRIVEWVRQHNAQEVSQSEFGRSIKKDYTPQDEPWTLLLLEKLQKEGILVYTQKGKHIKIQLGN